MLAPASRCSRTEAPEPPGWSACVTCGSCCGSPRSTTFAAARLTAAALASANWPASSTKSRSNASRCSAPREQPGGAGDELVLGVDAVVAVGLLDQAVRALVARALVDAGERLALLVGVLLDLVQEVLDRRVARRRDAHAPAGARARRRSCAPPRNVLPVPGGPCTGRTERSSPRVGGHERVDVLAQPAGAPGAAARGAGAPAPRRTGRRRRAATRRAPSAPRAGRRTLIGDPPMSAAGAGGGFVAPRRRTTRSSSMATTL